MGFLYTSNELLQAKDLNSGNYRTLKKEIEEDTNKLKYIHVNGLEELTSLNVHTT